MKFSIRTLLAAAFLCGLMSAALSGSYLAFGLMRLVALLALLMSIVTAIYGQESKRSFAVGWSICSAPTLTLCFLEVPLIGRFTGVLYNPTYGLVIDLTLSFAMAYFIGSFASKLSEATSEETS